MNALPATGSVALVAGTAAGRRQAARLAAAWPGAEPVEAGSIADGLVRAWSSGRPVVAFAATGIVVRVLGPLLGDKRTDPPVVVVDDAARHAIALLGGHAGGANALARRVGEVLGAEPVLTTASDAQGLPGLDMLGLPVEGAVAGVGRMILDGEPVRFEADVAWPLPALPPTVSPSAAAARYRLLVTDRVVPDDGMTAVLRPPTLVAGIGASRGVPAGEVEDLLSRALAGAGLARASLRHLATVDVKAGEAGIVEVARRWRLPLVTYPASVLAGVQVPNPSPAVEAAVGTPSVAEASALLPLPASPHPSPAELLVPKVSSAMATVAIARHAARGRLAIIGLGPGARDLLTPRAVDELHRASVVVGLDQYVKQVRDLLRPGTRVLASGLGQERERARAAVEQARAGRAVAIVGSGDAGIYAMASPVLEEADASFDVVSVPGVTAGLAAAAVLGAPLGHDHAYVSLSDLHTPWPAIEARVRAAAEGDLVVLFYNPRSRLRDWQLGAALAELAAYRPPQTPVGVVRNASRGDESVLLTTLKELDPAVVDMYSLVVVGSSQTRIVAGRMVTPRGYRWREKREEADR